MDKDKSSFVPSDALSRAIATIAERSQQIVSDFLERQSHDQNIASAIDPLMIGDAFLQMTAQMLASPVKLVEAQMSMWSDYMQMWQSTAQHLMGAPVDAAAGRDQPVWRQKDVYDFIKQTYLLTARWIQALVKKVDGLDEEGARQVDFYTKQFIDAMDPALLFANNPRLLQITIDSQGENLVKGLDHLLGDLERSKARLAGPSAAANALRIGQNVAMAKGEVVLRNPVIELLHYPPSGAKAHARPLLMIPPWTHKFYALDLRPANSLVQYLADHGHRVFVISWADNAGDTDLAAILKQGPLAAVEQIRKLTGERRVNGVGIGLGGALLAAVQALQAGKGEDCWQSASFLAGLLDFAEPGELSVFIAEEQLRRLENSENGAADRSLVNLLRANDLIWSFVIDSFHGERAPFPFDLLQWNADSLRAVPALQRFYLRDLYQHNALAKTGSIKIGATAIDLAKIACPAYVLAMGEDHLAPWRSAFAGTRLLSGPVRFVRAGSGHLSGLINPPAVQRHGFWTSQRTAEDAESWAKGARYQPGSWWEDWLDWLDRQAGSEIAVAQMPKSQFGPAPGTNVCARS
jgi:polyhydroxyalkanoate synthase